MPELVTHGPPVVVALGFVLAFLGLAAAVGRRTLALLCASLDEAAPAEREVIGLALGAGLLQFVPMVLGAVGALSVLACRVAVGLLLIAFSRDVLAVLKDAWRALTALSKQLPSTNRWVLIWLVALAPAVVIALAKALTPTLDADGLSYHLTAPKRWLESGWLHYLPTYITTNTPMGADMLFTLALPIGGDTAAKVTHFGLGMTAAVAVYLVGARMRGPVTGIVAVTLFLVGPAKIAGVLGYAYTEGAISLALSTSLLAWLIWFQGQSREAGRSPGWLRVAAFLVGVAVSFKLTAVLLAAAIVALTVWVLAEGEQPLAVRLRKALLGSLQMAPYVIVPVLPWLLRATIVTGNPVFPLAAGLIPSRDFAPDLGASYSHYNRYLGWGTGLGPSFTLAQRQMVLVAAAIVFVLLAAIVFVKMRSSVARGATVVVLVTALLQLATVGLYARYWVPLLSILQVPMVAVVAKLLEGGWQRIAIVVCTGLASLVNARASLEELGYDFRGMGLAAFGLETPNDFLTRHHPLYPIYEYANDHLGPDARIVLAYYCGSFYIDRDTFCSDNPQSALRFTSWNDFVSDMKSLGVTHVLLPRSVAEGGAPPVIMSSPQQLIKHEQYTYLNRVLGKGGKLLKSAGDQGLYSVDMKQFP